MNYVLVIDDEPEILEMLTMAAQVSTRDRVVACSCGVEALEQVKILGAPRVVVTDFRMPNGDGVFVYTELQRLHPQVPVIICSGNPAEELEQVFPKAYGRLTKPRFLGPLREMLEKLLKSDTAASPSYVSVPISYLLRLGVLDVDAFLKIGEDKYIKIHQAGDIFDRGDAERLRQKRLDYLLITQADARLILERFELFLKSQLKEKKLSPDQRVSTAQDVLETSLAFARSMGWTPETVTMARAAVDFAIAQVAGRKDWRSILQRAEGGSRYAQHISLLSLLTCVVAQGIGWSNEMTQQKLVMASLLHDFTLSDEAYDLLASDDEARKAVMRSSAEYREHPVKVAELARKIPDLPPDIDNILLQHHERPDGSGFPRRLTSAHISSLSALFIICHDLVDFIGGRARVEEIIELFWQTYESQYQRDPFKKIIKAMKELG